MPLKSRKQAERLSNEMMAEMFLTEIRRETGFTQKQIAASLGIRQPSLSKLESQDDMQISTLQRLIHALGGNLEIIAHMPNGDIRISQFAEQR